MSEVMAAPDPALCSKVGDVGQLFYDDETDVWYECVHDDRRDVVTWSILPPGSDHTEDLAR